MGFITSAVTHKTRRKNRQESPRCLEKETVPLTGIYSPLFVCRALFKRFCPLSSCDETGHLRVTKLGLYCQARGFGDDDDPGTVTLQESQKNLYLDSSALLLSSHSNVEKFGARIGCRGRW